MLNRFKLEEGWITLLLVWTLIATAASALIASNLIEGLHVLLLIGTVAVFTGLLLAKSNFSDGTAHTLALIYGLAFITYILGRDLPGDLVWRERILDLINRQAVWIGKAIGGGTSRDGLIFIMHTSGIFWLLGYTASWYTFRRPRVWRVVLPTGLVLLSVIYYYYGPKPLGIYLAIYALLSLIYVGRTHLVAQERTWRSALVRYERSGVRFGFMRASFIVAIVALAISWMLPTMSASAAVGDAISDVSQPWRAFQDDWTRLFSSLRSYGSGTNDPYQDSLVLGGPREVGNTPIMDIYVSERMPYIYWQAYALDTYDGQGGWSIADQESILHFPDEGSLTIPFSGARQVVTQTVVNYLPNSSSLYAAPEIIGSDRQMLVEFNPDAAGNMIVSGIRSRFVLRAGDRYTVQSQVSVADADSLRTASTDYPERIKEIYLQMPDTITPETTELAADIMAPYDNAYDKAIAVQNWMREHIAYNDQIPAPPENVEPVHYTLFVSQQAYCTYYASSMTMMLRSQGIPSRIVNGYAQGEFIEDANAYRVRANNAHTWVEAYFPGYGWIQFEPTASIPVVARPETALAGEAGLNPLEASPNELDREELLPEDEFEELRDDSDQNLSGLSDIPLNGNLTPEERLALIIRIVVGVTFLVVAGGLVLVANSWNQRIEANVEKSYSRLERWAAWLGVLFRPVHTPYERADMLALAVPEGREPIRNLTRNYVLRLFSRHRAEDEEFNPRDEWQTLRPVLLRQALRHRFQRNKKALEK